MSEILTGVYVPLEGKTEELRKHFITRFGARDGGIVMDSIVTDEISTLVVGEDILTTGINWINSHEGAQFGMVVDEKEESTVEPLYINGELAAWDIAVYLTPKKI